MSDIRKFMNLMESTEIAEYKIDETIQYDSLSRALWRIYQAGQANNESQAQDIISYVLDAVLKQDQTVD